MLRYFSPLLTASVLFALVFTACENSLMNSANELADEELISAIESADKSIVQVEALPSPAQREITAQKAQAFASRAQKAEQLGYKVEMRTINRGPIGESSALYFDQSGRKLQAYAGRRGGPGGGKGPGGMKPDQAERPFDLVMPYSVEMPDASIITINSEEDHALIRAWYEANPDVREKFNLLFPVTVIFEEEELTLDQEAFEALMASIRENRPFDRENAQGNRRSNVEIQFPYSVEMPDGSIITIEAPEDRSLIRAWYEANPDVEERFSFIFPLTLIVEGEEVVVNNEEEFQAVRAQYAEHGNGSRGNPCFEIQFPYDLIMPDQSILTITQPEDHALIRSWFAENEAYRGQRPTHVFPITLLVTDENGEQTEIQIQDEEELDAFRQENCDQKSMGGRGSHSGGQRRRG